MRDMKMKTKMIGAFGILILLTIINVLVGMSSVNRVSKTVSDMQKEEATKVEETMKEIGADEQKAAMLIEAISEVQKDDLERMNRSTSLSNLFSFGLVAVSIIITLIISTSLIKAINKSVSQLSKAAKEIALGHVDIEMVKYNNDEFGELIDAYTEVIDNIRYQAKIAGAVSNGDLTVQVNPKSDEDLLGMALKDIVVKNCSALQDINSAANQVSTSSSEVASASESLAQGSTQQASAIAQITASIDDVSQKTKQNAEEARNASNLVDMAISDVKKGNQHMHDMVEAMEEINASSESISKIIKVIDDIAFQTNILALNAAVEAARAGEAGKGFAVVAEEVRNLAAKSAAAAKETAELIEDSINKVEVGSGIANETAKALETITKAVEESDTLITGIAEASDYQATAIEQIDQAIEQVSQVVQTNSATSQQCAAASAELSSQANRMKELLSVYNLGNRSDTSSSYDYTSATSYQSNQDRNEQIISLSDGLGKY